MTYIKLSSRNPKVLFANVVLTELIKRKDKDKSFTPALRVKGSLKLETCRKMFVDL